MSWGAVAGAAIVTVGGLVASNQKSQAAKGAANAQTSATRTALEEEQRQFDLQFDEYQRKQALLEQQNEQISANLAPYITAGQGALYEMMALSGVAIPSSPTVPQGFTVSQPQQQTVISERNKLLPAPTAPTEAGKLGILSQRVSPEIPSAITTEGVSKGTAGPFGAIRGAVVPAIEQATGQAFDQAQALPVTQAVESPYAGMTGEQAQTEAISKIAQSPLLQELMSQGEQAILQQAAATGGLRGGNVQGLLAQYRPQMLQEEIDKQYARLSGISGMGQSAISQTPTQMSVGQAPTSNAASYMSQLGDIEATRLLTEAEAGGEALGAVGRGLGTATGAYFNRGNQG